ncbi:MAG TPA: cobalamin-dependent protein [Kofleriaceae bacterium]|jgi:hypothetical protein
MPATALLLVPPFLKVAFGPLLGPAMLVAAGREAGHHTLLVDLNAQWILERLTRTHARRSFVGDHDRPNELTKLHAEFARDLELSSPERTHETIARTARRIARTAFGRWATAQLTISTTPDVVGISVMYRDQVEPALSLAIVARERWPDALIIFGGAHVTALQDDIVTDARYGELVDRFVFGYAERTWVELLDAVADGTAFPSEIVRAGSKAVHRAKQDFSVTPVYEDLDRYQADRLTLSIQSSRGCRYGVCAYCTYPQIEGEPCDIPWAPMDLVIAEAVRRAAALSFKDSLLAGDRMEEIARRIEGRVPWSACTKLDADLPDRLAVLARGGCSTLEIGLETTHLGAQRLIGKRQRWETFIAFVDAATEAGIALVVNYMTDLPGIDRDEEERCMERVLSELERRRPRLVAKLEHNRFELERLSRMGRDASGFGMRVRQRIPWSSVLEWEHA